MFIKQKVIFVNNSNNNNSNNNNINNNNSNTCLKTLVALQRIKWEQ